MNHNDGEMKSEQMEFEFYRLVMYRLRTYHEYAQMSVKLIRMGVTRPDDRKAIRR